MSDEIPVMQSSFMPERVMAMIGLNTVLTHIPTGKTKVFDYPFGLMMLCEEAKKFQEECERAEEPCPKNK